MTQQRVRREKSITHKFDCGPPGLNKTNTTPKTCARRENSITHRFDFGPLPLRPPVPGPSGRSGLMIEIKSASYGIGVTHTLFVFVFLFRPGGPMSNLSGMDYFLFVTHTFFVFVLFCLGPAAQCQTCQVWTFRRDAHVFLFVKSELRSGDRAQAPARNYHSSGTSIPNSSITFRLIERPGQNKRILAPGPRRPRLATSTRPRPRARHLDPELRDLDPELRHLDAELPGPRPLGRCALRK